MIVKVLKPNGTLRCASPASGRVLGCEAGEAVGTMNVLDHAHPDDLPRVISRIGKIVSSVNGGTRGTEYRFGHRDSTWRCMEVTGLREGMGGGASF